MLAVAPLNPMPWPILAAVGTVIVALTNGANDNFKGVATLYGSGTLSYRMALAWATLTTLAGSLAAGFLSHGLVGRFTGKGLVDDVVVAEPVFLLAVAAGAALTLLLATGLGLPISTTHALMGSLVGAAVVSAGWRNVRYATLGSGFVLPLLLSPIVSLLLTAGLHPFFRQVRSRLGLDGGKCVCVDRSEGIVPGSHGAAALVAAPVLAIEVASLEHCRRQGASLFWLESRTALDSLHALSAGAVGFARGLNDTPKIAALLMASGLASVEGGAAGVALAMAAGGALAGRVARTLSFGMTAMSHGQAFTANLVTAALVTLASPLGLPVSTTHVSCGALIGIGSASGQAHWRTISEVLLAWVVTLPLAALLGGAAVLTLSTLAQP